MKFMDGSNLPQASPNYLICIRISTVVELCTTTSDTIHFLDCSRISPVLSLDTWSDICLYKRCPSSNWASLTNLPAVCWQFGRTPALKCFRASLSVAGKHWWMHGSLISVEHPQTGTLLPIGSTASPYSQLYKTYISAIGLMCLTNACVKAFQGFVTLKLIRR